MRTTLGIGTLSPLKHDAIMEALASLGIEMDLVAVDADSGVSAQPVGMTEIREGAANRARGARRLFGWSVGIENGIVECEDGWIDLAVLVLIDGSGKTYESLSRPIAFPGEDVERFFDKYVSDSGSRHSTVTVGRLIAERTGCDPTDPHAHLTGGRLSRKAILVEALIPLLSRMKEMS